MSFFLVKTELPKQINYRQCLTFLQNTINILFSNHWLKKFTETES